jgi:Na+/phosphate symporter
MNETCHRCGLRFERIEGHWIGAIGINTIVSFGILLVSLAVSFVVTVPDVPVVPLMIGHILLAIVVPVVFFPFSRTFWTAVDIAMRPLEAHEVNWAALHNDR